MISQRNIGFSPYSLIIQFWNTIPVSYMNKDIAKVSNNCYGICSVHLSAAGAAVVATSGVKLVFHCLDPDTDQTLQENRRHI